jgi:hypothetical protein
VRSPLFRVDFFHDIELKITLGDKLLQPRVYLLKLAKPSHIHRLKFALTFAPAVDGGFGHAVSLGDLTDGIAVGFAQYLDLLVFGESTLLHNSLALWGAIVSSFNRSENTGARQSAVW